MSAASLVVQTSFLGDTILSTPLIAELGSRGPVDMVVTPAAAELLSNNPFIRRLFVYDKRHRDSGVAGVWRMAREVRRYYREHGGEGPSSSGRRVAYLGQQSMRSAALALLAGFHERVGFETAPARALYSVRVPYSSGMHHAERLWRLALAAPSHAAPSPAAASTREMPPPRLYPGPAERHAVDTLLGGTTDTRTLVALAPGSVWATKRWPYYPELASRLAQRCRIVVVGSSADSDAALRISEAAGAQGVVDATGKLSLLGSAELIRRVSLIVSNDSSPQHLASAMGTPTITLFGPTVPEFGFGPLAPHSITLGHRTLTCRPCHHHGSQKCPLGHLRCMTELDVGSVEAAVWRVVGSRDQESGIRNQELPRGRGL